MAASGPTLERLAGAAAFEPAREFSFDHVLQQVQGLARIDASREVVQTQLDDGLLGALGDREQQGLLFQRAALVVGGHFGDDLPGRGQIDFFQPQRFEQFVEGGIIFQRQPELFAGTLAAQHQVAAFHERSQERADAILALHGRAGGGQVGDVGEVQQYAIGRFGQIDQPLDASFQFAQVARACQQQRGRSFENHDRLGPRLGLPRQLVDQGRFAHARRPDQQERAALGTAKAARQQFQAGLLPKRADAHQFILVGKQHLAEIGQIRNQQWIHRGSPSGKQGSAQKRTFYDKQASRGGDMVYQAASVGVTQNADLPGSQRREVDRQAPGP